MALLIPKLHAVKALDKDLLRPFRYCHRTWRDGAPILRGELIAISKRWKELELPETCPYALPPPDELLEHQREYRKLGIAQDLKNKLIKFLNTDSDGWLHTDNWDATQAMHKALFEQAIKGSRTPDSTNDDHELTGDELRSIWPFHSPS